MINVEITISGCTSYSWEYPFYCYINNNKTIITVTQSDAKDTLLFYIY